MRKTTIILLVIGAFIFSLAIGTEAQAEKKFLRMVSGPQGGSWYPLGAAMMAIVEKNIDISTSCAPGGGLSNCKAVSTGKADLGWTYSHTAYNGYEGRGKFDKRYTNMRHLMSLYPGVLQMAVPRKSDIYTVDDLKDKRIVPGKMGWTGTVTAEIVLKAYGLSFESIKKNGGLVSYVGYADSAALMKDGHSDCYIAMTSCPQATIIDLNFRPGIRMLPIDKAHMRKVLETEPGLMETVIPKSAYKGMTEDVPAVGTVTCLIVNKDLSDDLVYNIVKTLYANWPELAKVKKKAIEASKPEKATMGARIPMHPGALRYYKEKGYVK
jgi:TRAP transporter TAXI family solute receptor